jgi:phosphate transport system substrate-binding protein
MNLKKTAAALLLAVLPALPASSATTVTVKGSDTMVILAQRWAEAYMAAHPDMTIQVTGGGSGTGISALINGTTDICNASRPMKPAERQKLKERFNSLGIEIKAARDGLALYVNPSNPVQQLTIAQARDIYLGKITNWKDVGGPDAKILLYGRENNSGTYEYFRDHVLEGQDFSASMQSLPGTAAVVNAVSKDKNGIGFGGAAYGKGIRELKIAKDAGSKYYPPTEATIKSGEYPISRYLYMYLKARPTGDLKAYIDWILGAEGQKLVSDVGYFPIR